MHVQQYVPGSLLLPWTRAWEQIMVCITSLKAIGELQRERLCQSCATAFKLEWANAWIIPANEEMSVFVAPSLLPTQSVASGRHH